MTYPREEMVLEVLKFTRGWCLPGAGEPHNFLLEQFGSSHPAGGVGVGGWTGRGDWV